MPDKPCKLCSSQATCTVGDEPMCEAHGMYWSAVRGVEMKRFETGKVKATFDCIDSFEIKGRGQVLTGEIEGEVDNGDVLCRNDEGTVVVGIEFHPALTPITAERRKIGLLIRTRIAEPQGRWEVI